MNNAITNVSSALRAYKNGAAAAAPAAGGSAEKSAIRFSDYMRDALSSAQETLKSSEAVQLQGLQGKASTQEVVEAIMAAEMTVQMVTSVRDRAVQAYQELMRMPV